MTNSHPLPGGDRGPMHRCCVEPGSEGPLAPKRCLAGEAVLDRVHSVHVSGPRRGEEQWEWGRVWVRQPVPNAGRRGSYGCLGGRCGEIPRGPPAAVNLRENAIRRAVAVGDGQVGYRGGMGKEGNPRTAMAASSLGRGRSMRVVDAVRVGGGSLARRRAARAAVCPRRRRLQRARADFTGGHPTVWTRRRRSRSRSFPPAQTKTSPPPAPGAGVLVAATPRYRTPLRLGAASETEEPQTFHRYPSP